MLEVNKINIIEPTERKVYTLNLNDAERAEIRENKIKEEMQKTISEISKNAVIPIEAPPKPQKTAGIVALPDPVDFGNFYKELGRWGGGCESVSFDGNLISMKSSFVKIGVSVDAIVAMLAEKYNQPLPFFDAHEKVSGAPPFLEDMNLRVQQKINGIKMEFNRIMCFGDPRITKLSHDYHQIMSYPLRTYIQYLEWERSLISFKIEQMMGLTAMEYAAKEKNIREDYNQKKQEELSKRELIIRNLRDECTRLKVIVEHTNTRIQQYKEESQQFQSEIETLGNKNNSLDDVNQKQEAEISSLKTKNSELEKKYQELEKRNKDLVDRLMDMKEKAQAKPVQEEKPAVESSTPQEKIKKYLEACDEDGDTLENIAAELDIPEKKVHALLSEMIEIESYQGEDGFQRFRLA